MASAARADRRCVVSYTAWAHPPCTPGALHARERTTPQRASSGSVRARATFTACSTAWQTTCTSTFYPFTNGTA